MITTRIGAMTIRAARPRSRKPRRCTSIRPFIGDVLIGDVLIGDVFIGDVFIEGLPCAGG
jgi:hypothetical protein